MKKDLGWCSVELTKDSTVRINYWKPHGYTPDEARQLADALKEVADSYVDPVEAKARELLAAYESVWPTGERKQLEDFSSSGHAGWMTVARHVLASDKSDKHAQVDESNDRPARCAPHGNLRTLCVVCSAGTKP